MARNRSIARLLSTLGVLLFCGSVLAGVPATGTLLQSQVLTDFGSVALGQAVQRTVTLTASGSNPGSVTIGSTQLVPSNPAWAIVGGTCVVGVPMAPNQSCTIVFQFTGTGAGSFLNAPTLACSSTLSVVGGFFITCDNSVQQFAQLAASVFTAAVPTLSNYGVTALLLMVMAIGLWRGFARGRR